MATNCPACWRSFFSCCCDDKSSAASDEPLLGRPSPPMPPKKYGKRGPRTAPGASAIFGQSAAAAAAPAPDSASSLAAGLESAFRALVVSESAEERLKESGITYHSLLPLITGYKSDINRPMIARDWREILDDKAELKKIAEASYAEVYRVNTKAGSSILKVMRIKLPELPDSMNIETAIDVNSLISEIRIMNALTTVPGFVTFKDAHLVHGKIPRSLRKAWAAHRATLGPDAEESYFSEPPSDKEEAWFLVVELGDAGDVLDECRVDTSEKFWDIYIGVTTALARAEVTNQFEHRDLHENNICIKFPNEAKTDKIKSLDPLKFGYSGWEITIIDYGLSRCRLVKGDIAASDLEQDLSLFQGSAKGIAGKQYDTYRRMRSHLIDGTRTKRPKDWHKQTFHDTKHKCSWNDYIPYTNVLWLHYLYEMLLDKYDHEFYVDFRNPTSNELTLNGRTIGELQLQASELVDRLDPRTKIEDGAFSTAGEVLNYIIEVGWVTEEQITGDSTFLSED